MKNMASQHVVSRRIYNKQTFILALKIPQHPKNGIENVLKNNGKIRTANNGFF